MKVPGSAVCGVYPLSLPSLSPDDARRAAAPSVQADYAIAV